MMPRTSPRWTSKETSSEGPEFLASAGPPRVVATAEEADGRLYQAFAQGLVAGALFLMEDGVFLAEILNGNDDVRHRGVTRRNESGQPRGCEDKSSAENVRES